MNWIRVNEIIDSALQEDLGQGDITTEILVNESSQCRGEFIAKCEGIIAGLTIAELIFKKIDPRIKFKPVIGEGGHVKSGDVIAEISGPTAGILTGERVALNFLQRMSGIATVTHRCIEMTKSYNVKIVDTRKTTPGLRLLEKYAVRVGGGHNHRFSLSDAVLIKDNHIKALGGVENAVKRALENVSHTLKIEVEVETLEQVSEALNAKADIILLDNMDVETMRKAVDIIDGSAITEASGMITEQSITKVAAAGVDIISMGSLTHSPQALDISLNIVDVLAIP